MIIDIDSPVVPYSIMQLYRRPVEYYFQLARPLATQVFRAALYLDRTLAIPWTILQEAA